MSFLHKRGHPFAEIPGPPRHFLHVSFVFKHVLQGYIRAFVQDPLDQADRPGRTFGQLTCPSKGFLVKAPVWHQAVGQSDLRRLLCSFLLYRPRNPGFMFFQKGPHSLSLILGGKQEIKNPLVGKPRFLSNAFKTDF